MSKLYWGFFGISFSEGKDSLDLTSKEIKISFSIPPVFKISFPVYEFIIASSFAKKFSVIVFDSLVFSSKLTLFIFKNSLSPICCRLMFNLLFPMFSIIKVSFFLL